MSEDLQRQFAEFLKFLLTQAQDATTWAKTQIPPLIADKIWFGRIWHTIVAAGCVAAAWQAVRLARWCGRKVDEDEDEWFGGIIFSSIGAVILTGIAIDQLHDAVMAWVAPRLYIVEWLLSFKHS